MGEKYLEKKEMWLNSMIIDKESKDEILNLIDEKEIEDRFYKALEFGTGGLRGIIGAGDNRMNIYTVGKATEGLSRYLIEKFKENTSVCIAYDSRNMSVEFAMEAAMVLGGNGIKVYLFDGLRPTPELSFAVRRLNCNAGIVITASHNPKEYNGYKVYDREGCQITDMAANEIIKNISNIKYEDIKKLKITAAINSGLLEFIGEKIDEEYIDTLMEYTIRKELVKKKAKDLNIIYTPIHGTGLKPISKILKNLGYENLRIVEEQAMPDENFSTVGYPNPEDPKVFKLAIDMAKDMKADLILGTDPDADRIGVVIEDKGEYKILNGNQIGTLITHYIISSYDELNILPKNGAVVKTIVSTDMVKNICAKYNVEVLEVLTGFKYIGEMMTSFEKSKEKEYIFGFEESYGCLVGNHARDKDAVVGAQIIAEMALYYKEKNMNLYDAYLEISKEYGYYEEDLVSIELKGKEGQEKIKTKIDELRKNPIKKVLGIETIEIYDYSESKIEKLKEEISEKIYLPKSNVLKYKLEDNSWFAIRPSGTEPKLKIYFGVVSDNREKLKEKIKEISKEVIRILNL